MLACMRFSKQTVAITTVTIVEASQCKAKLFRGN